MDAAVGGKTGINFKGYKNEIGAFYPAEYVLISSEFFRTLDKKDILSGFAEMLKHTLIHSQTCLLYTSHPSGSDEIVRPKKDAVARSSP